jgi:S1-C subfamily serine protease
MKSILLTLFLLPGLSNVAQTVQTTRNAVVYGQADINSRKIDTALAGSTLNVVYSESYFYKISLPSGVQGFIKNHQATTFGYIPTKEEINKKLIADQWKETNIKAKWKTFGIDDKEGVYELIVPNSFVDAGVSKYELALVKQEKGYVLIYLSGGETYSNLWKEGDVKAKLYPTGKQSLFKVTWTIPSKFITKDYYIRFENSMMSLVDLDFGKYVYLKIYPSIEDHLDAPTFKGNGTGFFISNSGYIATNQHVIEQEKDRIEVEYYQNGIKYTHNAIVVVSDKVNDLAIIKIQDKGFKILPEIPFNFSIDLKEVGTQAFALGYPKIGSMGTEIKFTEGTISAKTGFRGQISNYQTSVPIQPGNSGGPLFDYEGNLIGINTSYIKDAKSVFYAIKPHI